MTAIARFFAYADPGAGGYGAVYQAAYLGQSLNGHRRRHSVLPFAQARTLGWRIAVRDAKRVYATHVGRGRRKWRKELGSCPIPHASPKGSSTPARQAPETAARALFASDLTPGGAAIALAAEP